MTLKLEKTHKIVVLVFLLFVILVAYYQFYVVQRETQEMWKTIVSGYTMEKNTHLNNIFFFHARDKSSIDNLNWHYFRVMIDNDLTLRNLQLVRLNIYDTDEVLRHSYSRDHLDRVIEDDALYDLVNDNIRGNETTVILEEYKGRHLGVVITPLIRRNNMHFLTLVYVFDIAETSMANKHIFDTILIGLATFIAFILLLSLCRKVVEKNIDNLTKSIDFSITENNKPNPYPLNYEKPFNILSQKISYLISHKKEIEKKYLEYSDKFYYFINLTGEGLVMEDETGYIYFCNKKFVEILGYEDESELLGVKMTDLFYSTEDVEKYENSINITYINVQSTNKVDFLTKGGIKKECILTKKVITNNQNQISGFYCAVTDIVGVSTFSHSQSEIQQLRSSVFEQYNNPLAILDQDEKIIDVNEAFINIVNKGRNDLLSQTFIEAIKGFELEKVWHPSLKDFELFEPGVNRWYQIIVKSMQINNDNFKLIHAFSIEQFKKQTRYNKLILSDFRGFYFITDRENQVLYVSQSFTNITHNTEEWFADYYKALLNLSITKSQNLIDNMTISYQKKKFEFRIVQLFTYNETMILYQAVLK